MSKHSNREKEVMLWINKNYHQARVFRFDNGQAYAKFSVKAALEEYKRTGSITLAFKKLIVITYGVEGWPDLFVIYMGRAFGIEIKVGKDRQRQSQKNMELAFKISGATYKLVDDKSSIDVQVRPTMDSIEKAIREK